MLEGLISTAEQMENAIDCRCLTLSVEYYRLSPAQVIAFCTEVVCWLENLTDGGFVRKRTDTSNKRTTKEKALLQLQERIRTGYGWVYLMEAFAPNPVVRNAKSMSRYGREAGYFLNQDDLLIANDYVSYWKELFPEGRPDNDRIQKNIVKIFREENRKRIAGYGLPDVQAGASACPYKSNTNLLWGDFSISINAYSLQQMLSSTARLFIDFGKHLSETYINLNARVMLQPLDGGGPSPYIRYFGAYLQSDGSHLAEQCQEREWYSTYYLPGVEWVNIISPLARRHIPKIDGQTAFPMGITASELRGGGLLVRSTKEIGQYDISDSLILKKLLYPALYPGRSSIPLSILFPPREYQQWPIDLMSWPRRDWEIVPILEEEIQIVYTYLVFSSIESPGDDEE